MRRRSRRAVLCRRDASTPCGDSWQIAGLFFSPQRLRAELAAKEAELEAVAGREHASALQLLAGREQASAAVLQLRHALAAQEVRTSCSAARSVIVISWLMQQLMRTAPAKERPQQPQSLVKSDTRNTEWPESRRIVGLLTRPRSSGRCRPTSPRGWMRRCPSRTGSSRRQRRRWCATLDLRH